MMYKSVRTTDPVSMRDSYTQTLLSMADTDERIVAIEADVMASMGTTPFAKKYPERSINCGIQEANAVCVAAALGLEGFIPFFHAFGIFATRRVFDQVFLSVGYQKSVVKIVGGDAGVTAAANGGTHMPFEDMALMRAVPGMVIVDPADTVAVRALLPQLTYNNKNTYIRCSRKNMIRVYEDDAVFTVGKANVLRDGTDVTLFAAGCEVDEALIASEKLDAMGISARVVDSFTVKPIDTQCVAESARKTGCIVTCENHNVIGGLAEAVCAAVCETVPVPVEKIGVKESFGEVGTIADLKKRFELTADDIVKAALKAIERKNNK